MLSFHRLQVLVTFAKQRTIVSTAKRLGYTPSAVSQQLSVLEKEAGVPLLERSPRRAALTDAGHTLVAHAERILASVEAAESALAAQSDQVAGQVTVTAFPTAAVAFASQLVTGLSEHGQLRIVVRQTQAAIRAKLIGAGEVDVAIVEYWTSAAQHETDPHVQYEHLFRDPLVLAVPEDHALATVTRPVDPATLMDETWIVPPDSEPSRAGIDELLDLHGGTPDAAWEYEGQGTMLSLVARGVGIAAVPSLAMELGIDGVAFHAFAARTPARDIYAIARHSSLNRPSIAVTLAALRDGARAIQEDMADQLADP